MLSRKFFLFFITTVFIFICYQIFVAPSVTFEDSGELLVASYFSGLAHPPGYPLFLILLKIWIQGGQLATSNIAYLGNLFSAFTMSLSAGFFALLADHLIFDLIKDWRKRWIIVFIGVLSYAFADHVLRQSLIVEVYGLHNLIVAICIYLIVTLKSDSSDERINWFLISLFLGLGMSNHHLTLVLGFCYLAYLFIANFEVMQKMQFWTFSTLGFTLGLTPYLYFWMASVNKPIFSWGHVHSFQELIFHITRSQYNPQIVREQDLAIDQQITFVKLAIENMEWSLLLGLIGLIFMFFKKDLRSILWFLLLIGFGPLTAFLTNFITLQPNPMLQNDMYNLISVFYLPFYFVSGILIVFGIANLLNFALVRKQLIAFFILAASTTIYFSARAYQAIQAERKDDYLAPIEFYQNISALSNASTKSLVLTNWDPFSFPIFYLQLIENRFPNLIVLDIELLKAPWYMEFVKNRYPEVIQSIEPFFKNLLQAEKDFVKTKQTTELDTVYYTTFINKLVESELNKDTPVFLTISRDFTRLQNGLLSPFSLNPYFVATKIELPGVKSELTKITKLPAIHFRYTNRNFTQHDRLTKMFQNYYAQIIQETLDSLNSDQAQMQDELKDILTQLN